MNLFIFICQQTLIFLVPLLLVGLGDLFSERSGVLNIALEGIMVFGAFAGIMFIRSASAAMPSWLVLLIAILISILAGMLLSALHAFASIHLKAEQTISSTAIITFATAFCIFYARVMLGTEQVVFRTHSVSTPYRCSARSRSSARSCSRRPMSRRISASLS